MFVLLVVNTAGAKTKGVNWSHVSLGLIRELLILISESQFFDFVRFRSQ